MPAPTFEYTYDMSSQLQRVRRLIGDTDSTDPLLYDQEIGLYLTGGEYEQTSDLLAAARCADDIAGKMTRRVSISAGGTSVSLDQQRTQFVALAKDLRRRAALSVSPFAGGISRDDKISREGDTDRTEPAFTRRRDRTSPADEGGFGYEIGVWP